MMNDEIILVLDIGNTNTHVGIANGKRVQKRADIPTANWFCGKAAAALKKFVGANKISGAIICSVVPRATPEICKIIRATWKLNPLELNFKTVRGIGIDYPKPDSIGADRLANAVAAKFHFGAPVIVVDFGTAVTFDVLDAKGNYVGGIIAPGLEIGREHG